MSKPTVLLDIDHTILDLDALKVAESAMIEASYGEGSAVKFWEVYQKVRKEKKIFEVEEVAMKFAQTIGSTNYASAVSVFLEVDFGQFLFKGARELLDYLTKRSNLVIFTLGDELFQRQKVEKLGLDKISKKVIITQSKRDSLPKILEEFKEPYIVIDDDAQVIAAACEQSVPITTILVSSHHSDTVDIKADFEANNLRDVLAYLKKKLPLTIPYVKNVKD